MNNSDNGNGQSLINVQHEAILSTTFIGTLSTIRHNDGCISNNPVSYIWNGEELEISTLKSRMKYKNLLANPSATICVISPEDHMRYVEIRGTVRFVDDPDREYLRYNFKKLSGENLMKDMDPPDSERVTLYLHPDHVSSLSLHGGWFDKSQD